jgi:hypothetical protein
MTGFTNGLSRHSAAGVEREEEGGEEFCDEGEDDMSLRRVSYGKRLLNRADA